ncbi:MAG: hypothetical protein AB8B67_01405 [Rickettsiaceae bacterium]
MEQLFSNFPDDSSLIALRLPIAQGLYINPLSQCMINEFIPLFNKIYERGISSLYIPIVYAMRTYYKCDENKKKILLKMLCKFNNYITIENEDKTSYIDLNLLAKLPLDDCEFLKYVIGYNSDSVVISLCEIDAQEIIFEYKKWKNDVINAFNCNDTKEIGRLSYEWIYYARNYATDASATQELSHSLIGMDKKWHELFQQLLHTDHIDIESIHNLISFISIYSTIRHSIIEDKSKMVFCNMFMKLADHIKPNLEINDLDIKCAEILLSVMFVVSYKVKKCLMAYLYQHNSIWPQYLKALSSICLEDSEIALLSNIDRSFAPSS